MAVNTSKFYRNQVMYSIFVRNYSEEGNYELIGDNCAGLTHQKDAEGSEDARNNKRLISVDPFQ